MESATLEPQPGTSAPTVALVGDRIVVQPRRGHRAEFPIEGPGAVARIGFVDLSLKVGTGAQNRSRRRVFRRCWFLLDADDEPLAFLGGDPAPLYHTVLVKRFCQRAGLTWHDRGIIGMPELARLTRDAVSFGTLPDEVATAVAPPRVWLLTGLVGAGILAGYPLMGRLVDTIPQLSLLWVLGIGFGALFAPILLCWPMQWAIMFAAPRTVRVVTWLHRIIAVASTGAGIASLLLGWADGRAWLPCLLFGVAAMALLIPPMAKASMVSRDPRTLGAKSWKEGRRRVRRGFTDFRPIGAPPHQK